MINKPCHETTCLRGFRTRSDTNHAVQPQKMVEGLQFWIYEVEGICTIYVVKTKALISWLFSHDRVQMKTFLTGDLRDDHNPDFLREYHRALSVVCSDLFFARFRRSTQPRTDNVQGALQLLQSMFGECHTEDEKVKMVDDLLDVKLLPATNVEGVHFNTERLRERYCLLIPILVRHSDDFFKEYHLSLFIRKPVSRICETGQLK